MRDITAWRSKRLAGMIVMLLGFVLMAAFASYLLTGIFCWHSRKRQDSC